MSVNVYEKQAVLMERSERFKVRLATTEPWWQRKLEQRREGSLE